MDEHVLAAAFGLDKSVTLCALNHPSVPLPTGDTFEEHDLSRAKCTARFAEIL
jgi:hypothetical protein